MSRIKTIILGPSQKVVWPCSCHLQHTTHCQNCFATGAIPRPEKCNDTGDAVTCQHCTCRGSNSSYMTLYQNYSTTRASITRSKDDPKILTHPPNLVHWYQPHLDKAKWQSMTILSDWMCDDCVESTPQNTPTLLCYPPTWPEDHLIPPKTNRTLISNET